MTCFKKPPTLVGGSYRKHVIFKHCMFRNTLIVLVATMLTFVLNYAFQLYVGRALGPVDYGTFAALIGGLYIVSVPATSIQLILAKRSSEFVAEGGRHHACAFALKSLKMLALACIVIVVGVVAFGTPLASLMSIQTFSVVVLALVVAADLLQPVGYGLLRGLEMFGLYGINISLGTALKLAFGVLFISLGLAVNGALLALAVAGFATILTSFLPIRGTLARASVQAPKCKHMFRQIAYIGIATLLLAVFGNMDVIFARLFIAGKEAGYYAAASLIAKTIFFASGAVTAVLLPRIAGLNAVSKDTRNALQTGMVYTGILCAAGVVAIAVFPGVFIDLLFGIAYSPAAGLLAMLGAAAGGLALINTLATHNLVRQRINFLLVLGAGLVLQVAAIAMFHSTTTAIASAVLAANAVTLAALVGINRRELSSSKSEDLGLKTEDARRGLGLRLYRRSIASPCEASLFGIPSSRKLRILVRSYARRML